MKILFECDDGNYIVEVLPTRLYAKIHPEREDLFYGDKFNLMLNPGSFHEYREGDKMLQNRIDKLIREDLQKAK